MGPDGEFIEEWTQQKIADVVGVSRQTVNRWVNSAVPTITDWPRHERLMLFFLILNAREETIEEYLFHRRHEDHAETEPQTAPAGSEEHDSARNADAELEQHLFTGLDDDLW